uniref:GIY-YIG homing endonuclease n=1 Tax=Dunaliella salina TaxID=3046 RepID=A0A1C9FRX9_DUNSA|nr:GIY-YIG homing endonuclease [Dunaliella salina]
MRARFVDKTKHPMFGKKHTPETILLLSKPGNLNPMYGKKHSQETIDKLRMAKSKYRVELYDLNNNLIKTFLNNVELANYLNIHKTTVARYIKSQKVLLNKYFVRKHLY